MTDKCLLCGGAIEEVVAIPPVPLQKCEKCQFVQPKYVVSVDYSHHNVPVDTRRSDMLLAIVQKAKGCVPLKQGDRVLDIGCGDGTLLGWYEKGITTVGTDPSIPLMKVALTRGRVDVGITDTFSLDHILKAFHDLSIKDVSFKVITAIDVVHLLQTPKSVFEAIKQFLSPDGVAIVQVPYLGSLIASKAAADIKREYSSYFLTFSLQEVVKSVGLEFQGMELQPTGTIRAYISQPGFELQWEADQRGYIWTNAQMKIMEECRLGFYDLPLYKKFEETVKSQRVHANV